MVVERIKKLDIDNRPLFTGIYGYSYGQEYFIENNLCKYNFWQELYRYLRAEGYTTVFYNTEFNFFSYEESQLETLFFKKPEQISAESPLHSQRGRFIAPIASPNGHNRRRGIRMDNNTDSAQGPVKESAETGQTANQVSSSDQLESHRPRAILVKKIVGDQFFQIERNEGVLRHFFDFMDRNPNHKLAIVFTKPDEISFLPDEESAWRTRLQTDYGQQYAANSKHRLLVCYDVKDVRGLYDSFQRGTGGFFFNRWFQDQMFPNYSDAQHDLQKPSSALFYVNGWGREEVGNVLKRRRIMEGLRYTLAPIPFEDLCLRIWQQFRVKDPITQTERDIDTVKDFMLVPKDVLENQLQKMDNEKAINKLRKLLGMEQIITQFERYLEDYRACRESGERFRPHMVFMGNPGTGKTTVARIFADILREEGLLENGRLHQVTVGDLVSPYIGDTRIKAHKVCDQARGGVLFIDEAYGLYQSGSADTDTENGGNRHGREAIEVLLQFMENDRNSLVIMAGYPHEMEDLLKNGNVGFNSRIGEQGRFMFEDYKPEVLLKIALSKIEDTGYTEQFKKSLLAIFVILYRFKDKDWANARTAENIISKIKSNYRARHLKGLYDDDSIPDDLMRLIRIPSADEEKELTKELDNMLGLRKVKQEINKIFGQAKINHKWLKKQGRIDQKMADLTFIFEGNPGTGKTTVARLMGKILAGYGLIMSPEVKEYGLGNIVSGIHGGSVKRVNEMFDNCIGKVLFIDEAHTMAAPEHKDIVDQIVQNLTHPKYQGKMAVILAGYPNKMKSLMDVNPGFDRRFKYHFKFEDYTEKELLEMFKKFLEQEGMKLSDGCDDKILAWFKMQNKGKNPHNAGLIKDLYDEVVSLMGLRLVEDDSDDETILATDIPETRRVTAQSDEEVLAELNKLIGLHKVKETMCGIIDDVRAGQIRAREGQVEESKVGLNFVFKGNPGTGKTTVARLLGKILVNYGLIDEPEVVTYSKDKIIDGVVGGGSRNVVKMFEESVGKVLFIDEAYQLADHDSKEALDTLTNMLTDERFKDRLAVILAGYPGEMAKLISTNPGLKSRFTQDIFFEDYTNEELTEIFRRKLVADHFVIGEEALIHARAYFTSLRRNKDFGNARETEKLREKVRMQQGRRISKAGNPTREEVFTIMPQDFPNFGKIKADKFKPQQEQAIKPMEKLNKLIGIDSIRKQFEVYVKMAHYCMQNPQADISSTFRPHMAFLGNPGTGKTTVARLFAEILRQEGLLTNSNFVELGPSDLIGEYLGQSGPKARNQFERARGGILFIDEAYQLCRRDQVHGGDQYGKEVITELLKFMEDERDTVVILAGYTDEIKYLIQHGNPGLSSRVTNEFIFNDYEPDVLYQILLKKLGEHEMTEGFKDNMQRIISFEYERRKQKEWGNARVIENYANEIFRIFLAKHNAEGAIDSDCIPDRLMNDLMQGATQQVAQETNEAKRTSASTPSSLIVDLTTNPIERRVTDPNMLKECATGLLSSSSGEGTGFIISIVDRYVLTCSHVVEGAGNDLVFRMNCNKAFETMAHLIWNNYEQDMAILQLDELPDNACFVQLDNNIEIEPQGLTELVLCGYPDGSAFASTPSLISGSINNYEKQHVWNDRCFDTIYANVSATHGCSGGPVVRKSDMVLVGILQGGKEGGEIQFITDIHQLFRNIKVKS